MKIEIEDLLADAADDSAQPLNHSIDDIIHRGRRGTRLRQAGMVTASALTVGAVVGVFTLWPGGDSVHPNGGGIQPAGPGVSTGSTPSSPGISTGSTPSSPGSPTGPTPRATLTMDVKTGELIQPSASKLTDAQIIAQCKKQDADFLRFAENKAGGGTDKLDNWEVKITQGQENWFRAILQSPDGKRYARCQYRTSGSGAPGEYYDRQAVNLTRPYEIWSGADGSWGQVETEVARVTFQVGDEQPMEATVANGFYVFYAPLPSTEVKGKPIWATFYDAAGKELARFDSNGSNPDVGHLVPRDPIFPK